MQDSSKKNKYTAKKGSLSNKTCKFLCRTYCGINLLFNVIESTSRVIGLNGKKTWKTFINKYAYIITQPCQPNE